MAKYTLSNKAVDDLSKIWDYTTKFGLKIRLTSIIMTALKIVNHWQKIKT